MALQVLDFVKFKLASSFNPSTDTTVTIIAESDIYTLALQRQGVDVSNFRLTIVEKTDTSQFIRVSVGSIASQSTVDGKLQYVCNIEDSDASNPMVGLANDDDGTNGDANIIAGNVSGLTITEFSTDSVCIIAVGSAEYNELKGVFTAGTTTNTAEAGEDIEALDSVSLHTDGKLYEYHSTNYPNLVGAVSSAYSTGATATYTTFGGVSTGHSGLTVGATQYAEDTGTITETSSTTTTLLGTAESATTIRVVKAGDSVTEFSDNTFKIKDNSDATKIAAFEASGITTATTRTYTLPDADGTVVTTGTADIPDNVLNITDNSDATKKIAFEASGITTGTTRTITMPDEDVDLGAVATNSAILDYQFLYDSGSHNVQFTSSVSPTGSSSGTLAVSVNFTSPTTTSVGYLASEIYYSGTAAGSGNDYGVNSVELKQGATVLSTGAGWVENGPSATKTSNLTTPTVLRPGITYTLAWNHTWNDIYAGENTSVSLTLRADKYLPLTDFS